MAKMAVEQDDSDSEDRGKKPKKRENIFKTSNEESYFVCGYARSQALFNHREYNLNFDDFLRRHLLSPHLKLSRNWGFQSGRLSFAILVA